jgi:hypothetical protein
MTAITDDLPAQLIHQEREGWDSLCHGNGGTFYHHAMTPDGVLILEDGIVERDAAIAALEGQTWDSYAMSEHRLVRVGERAAVLVYQVLAHRGEQVFERRMATTYAYSEGRWRVAVHQQTRIR